MSWSSDGTLGATSDKTAGTSIAHTVTATAEAGKFVLVAVSKDNTGTTDADHSEVTSVTDSAGNTYLKAREFTNGQGVAADGVTVSLWYSVLTTQLGSGSGVITANFSGSTTASAITAWEFTFTANRIVVAAGVDQADDGADPSSMTVTPGTSMEYLFVRATATEGPGSGWTITTNYTALTSAGTAGGAGTSNARVGGEFRILTATGDTSDPTVATADNASVFVAFQEATSHSAAAGLTGAATLTADGTVTSGSTTHQGEASLAGATSLSAAAKVTHSAQGALAGAASIAAEAKTTHRAEASLGGAASLSAAAVVTLRAQVALSGAASLAATAKATHYASALLAGAASITATPTVLSAPGWLVASDGPATTFVVESVETVVLTAADARASTPTPDDTSPTLTPADAMASTLTPGDERSL